MFVCGDSAGGNLATVLAINSSKKNIVPIQGQILIYPCVDLTLTMRSMDINLDGMTLTYETMNYFIDHYFEYKPKNMKRLINPFPSTCT